MSNTAIPVVQQRYNVLIVDDEPLARENVSLVLKDIDKQECIASYRECSSGMEAISIVCAESEPERLIVFLDIQMPEQSGFEVVQTLKNSSLKALPVIVFVTAFDHYALQAFQHSALDYVLKPFDDERMEEVWKRAMKRSQEQQALQEVERLIRFLEDRPLHTHQVVINEKASHHTALAEFSPLERFILKERGRTLVVEIERVIWIEAQDYYVQIHTADRAYLLRESLTRLEKLLPKHVFVRTHRSAIVNVRHIAVLNEHEYGDGEIVLKNATHVKFSRTYKQPLLECLRGNV